MGANLKKIWIITIIAMAFICYLFIDIDQGDSSKSNPGKSMEKPKIDKAASEQTTIEGVPEVLQKSSKTAEETSADDGSVSDAITGLAVPRKNVRVLFDDFHRNINPSQSEKIELLSALSFCANRINVAAVIGNERGRGSTDMAEMQALKSTHEDYVKYCGDLPDGAYHARRDILNNLANQGDVNAKAMYFEVGPLGRWPQPNEHVPMTNEQIDSWVDKSIEFLRQNSGEGNFQAYKTLATIYGGTADDPILGRVMDPVKAYTYDYLWVNSIMANPNTSLKIRNEMGAYLARISNNLTADQRALARVNAMNIHLATKSGLE
jgi:hypothetical protein